MKGYEKLMRKDFSALQLAQILTDISLNYQFFEGLKYEPIVVNEFAL